jgi:hypothetical protein
VIDYTASAKRRFGGEKRQPFVSHVEEDGSTQKRAGVRCLRDGFWYKRMFEWQHRPMLLG